MPNRNIGNIIAGRGVITATPETTVRAACQSMAEKRIGALLILEKSQIVGIFTERDALNKVLAGNLDPDKTQLVQVMARGPQTIRADKPLAHALYMMDRGGFRHVPVVDEQGQPIGMVSARDALGQEVVDLERQMKHLEELEASIGY